ncbi:hypothetical protein OAF42_00480 [Planctomicrobium sp.]|jgi:hypothetical protein|nr:hypothetical protein [Planctomicrobium sp.]MBT5020304.1 hypothetical protein [Planctomicrobium sp.]MDA7528142.1 hypothetical protein [bacterium]MDB4732894.1 hypothetical protein [Planctomicrobium sp.]
MNIEAIILIVMSLPSWLGVAFGLMSGNVFVSDSKAAREGRKRSPKKLSETFTLKHNPKEYWSQIGSYFLFAIILSGIGIWLLVTDSHIFLE